MGKGKNRKVNTHTAKADSNKENESKRGGSSMDFKTETGPENVVTASGVPVIML